MHTHLTIDIYTRYIYYVSLLSIIFNDHINIGLFDLLIRGPSNLNCKASAAVVTVDGRCRSTQKAMLSIVIVLIFVLHFFFYVALFRWWMTRICCCQPCAEDPQVSKGMCVAFWCFNLICISLTAVISHEDVSCSIISNRTSPLCICYCWHKQLVQSNRVWSSSNYFDAILAYLKTSSSKMWSFSEITIIFVLIF